MAGNQQPMLVQEGTTFRNVQNLEKVIDSHPFTHQLDVIFTDSEERAQTLAVLDTTYYKARITFSALFASSSSATTVLSVASPTTEDIWCLDARGILSLSLTRDTYERLGIGNTGTLVGSSNRKYRFLVRLDLHDRTSLLATRAMESLRQWDIRRAEAGEDGWDVLLSLDDVLLAAKQNVRPLLRSMINAHTPSHVIPITNELDSVHDDLAGLFEWVGLASLRSQRLLVDDSINPYAASYEPPSGSSVGKIFHLRWIGFLSPAFVHSILKEVLTRSGSLRAMSALSFDMPASYISSSGATRSGENAWTLIVSETEFKDSETKWVLVETDT